MTKLKKLRTVDVRKSTLNFQHVCRVRQVQKQIWKFRIESRCLFVPKSVRFSVKFPFKVAVTLWWPCNRKYFLFVRWLWVSWAVSFSLWRATNFQPEPSFHELIPHNIPGVGSRESGTRVAKKQRKGSMASSHGSFFWWSWQRYFPNHTGYMFQKYNDIWCYVQYNCPWSHFGHQEIWFLEFLNMGTWKLLLLI